MFADSQPRSTDTELQQFMKYANRQVDRFMSTHALTWTPESGTLGARLIDDDNNDIDILEGRGAGRGRRKKYSILLPLLLFLKLKLLIVPILLIVIFIKKMLVAGAFLIPSFLAHIKQKEHHAVAFEHPHHDHHHGSQEYGEGSEYGAYGGDSYKAYGRIGKRNANNDIVYHAYVMNKA